MCAEAAGGGGVWQARRPFGPRACQTKVWAGGFGPRPILSGRSRSSQRSLRVAAKAAAFNSLAHWASASLHPPLAALGSAPPPPPAAPAHLAPGKREGSLGWRYKRLSRVIQHNDPVFAQAFRGKHRVALAHPMNLPAFVRAAQEGGQIAYG